MRRGVEHEGAARLCADDHRCWFGVIGVRGRVRLRVEGRRQMDADKSPYERTAVKVSADNCCKMVKVARCP